MQIVVQIFKGARHKSTTIAEIFHFFKLIWNEGGGEGS